MVAFPNFAGSATHAHVRPAAVDCFRGCDKSLQTSCFVCIICSSAFMLGAAAALRAAALCDVAGRHTRAMSLDCGSALAHINFADPDDSARR